MLENTPQMMAGQKAFACLLVLHFPSNCHFSWLSEDFDLWSCYRQNQKREKVT
jgi:hypothetical protein